MDLDDEELKATRRMNGSDKNVGSIEKLIEELTKVRLHELSKDGLKLFEYINEIIDRNKELEEENVILKKAHNISENVTIQDITNVINKSLEDFNKEYIPVSLVEEKIEELSEDLEIMKVDAMYGRCKEYGSKLAFEKQFSYKYGMHDILQELLEGE